MLFVVVVVVIADSNRQFILISAVLVAATSGLPDAALTSSEALTILASTFLGLRSSAVRAKTDDSAGGVDSTTSEGATSRSRSARSWTAHHFSRNNLFAARK